MARPFLSKKWLNLETEQVVQVAPGVEVTAPTCTRNSASLIVNGQLVAHISKDGQVMNLSAMPRVVRFKVNGVSCQTEPISKECAVALYDSFAAAAPLITEPIIQFEIPEDEPETSPANLPAPSAEPTPDLLDQAVRIVISENRCSLPLLQWRLGIGYAAASKLLTTMIDRGVVGRSGEGENATIGVLMTIEEWEKAITRKAC